MKVRQGFVSNSSSSSFIVEVKGDQENILNSLYENIEYFQEENYKNLLEEAITRIKNKLKKELSDSEKEDLGYNLEEYKLSLDVLNNFVINIRPSDLKTSDNEYYIWKEKKHIKDVVMGVLMLLGWSCSKYDDGYISFADTTIIYNGWESISPRKTLIEMLAFFVFMKFEVRTRIESELT